MAVWSAFQQLPHSSRFGWVGMCRENWEFGSLLKIYGLGHWHLGRVIGIFDWTLLMCNQELQDSRVVVLQEVVDELHRLHMVCAHLPCKMYSLGVELLEESLPVLMESAVILPVFPHILHRSGGNREPLELVLLQHHRVGPNVPLGGRKSSHVCL